MSENISTAYQGGTVNLVQEPSMDDLLNITEMTSLTVHGLPILVSVKTMNEIINAPDSAISSKDDLIEIMEGKYSKEDVEVIYKEQVHRRIVGRELQINEIGDATPVNTETLQLVVPDIKLETTIIEKAIEASELEDNEDFESAITYLPTGEKVDGVEVKIPIITGNTFRTFLNDIQQEDGGLDMNQQITVYSNLLVNLPDEDPTKKLALMQMRALMLYGDVVSNKELRLALTRMIKEA